MQEARLPGRPGGCCQAGGDNQPCPGPRSLGRHVGYSGEGFLGEQPLNTDRQWG